MTDKKIILLSMKPKYASGILSGMKKVELRRSIPKLNKGDCVVIYASAPKKAVVGYFIVENSVVKTPELLWDDVCTMSGLSKSDFFEYFQNCDSAHAIYIQSSLAFSTEITYDKLPCKPTQNFRYLNTENADLIISHLDE